MNFSTNFHAHEARRVMVFLETSEYGLSSQEAKKRLKKYGPNELPEAKRPGYFSIFLRQFQSPLIYILLFSGVVVIFMREFTDAAVIFFVLFFNAIVGTIQEGKAQNTFLALKKFIKGNASVIRSGQETEVLDKEVVMGDVIVIREGEKIPADARLISCETFRVDEAAITGESLPKLKTDKKISEEVAVMNQENMIWKGTVAVSGSAKAVVVATGIETYLGNIARETLGIKTEFPLKSGFRKLSQLVIYFVLIVSVIFSILGFYGNLSFLEIFKTVVAISVSIIPEGLPIVITLVLARGVWEMGKKNVLVKKLPAVEVLGEIEVLAVDKTGTVTKNELVVEEVFCGGKKFTIGGIGYSPEGTVSLNQKIIDPPNHPELLLCAKIATLSSSANLILKKSPRVWRITGDPTDGAMTVLARKMGFNRADLLGEMPILGEVPFDYTLKYHASLHKDEKDNFLAVSGSPEVILNLCNRNWENEKNIPLNSKKRKELEEYFLEMSRAGFRVIALAFASCQDKKLNSQKLPPLVFAGFLGIKDALRKEVRGAVKKVEESGIKVVMITGDHLVTAQSIAQEAGIYKKGDSLIGGEEIDNLSEEELAKGIKEVSVFWRVTPDHKLKIIRAYKLTGTVVAMTGDGVNDTLSLTAADIGICMGRMGTDVAKEASDFILLDDNFGSVVYGVNEGRNIFSSIKRVILYLFSTSLGEALTIIAALFLGFPLPILAAQILWLNLVTDGFLDIALAMEGYSEKNLKKKNYTRNFFMDKTILVRICMMAAVMAMGTIFLFSLNYQHNIAKAWTVSLTTLAVFQWINAWNCRDEKKSFFSKGFFSNKYLILATILVIALQLLAVYNPLFQKILKTVPLSFSEWLITIAVALSILVVEETRKFFARHKA